MSRDGPKDLNAEWTYGHFALFVLVEMSNNEVNKILQETFDGYDLREYYFWLADTWSNAPTKDEPATRPPIAEDWHSPFYGKTIEDVVACMKELPEDRYVDYHHFAVLGEDYTKRRLVTIYRIGDEYLVGHELDSLTCSVKGSALFLAAMKAHYWEETKYTPPIGEPVG